MASKPEESPPPPPLLGSGGDRQAVKGPAGTQPEQLRRRCGDDERWGGEGGCAALLRRKGGGGSRRGGGGGVPGSEAHPSGVWGCARPAGGGVRPARAGGGAHAQGNTERQVVDGLRTEVCGQQQQSNDPSNIQHSPNTPTAGLRERGNNTSKSTGRTGRQNAATRRNMRRENG